MVGGSFEFVRNNKEPGFGFSGVPIWEKYFEEFDNEKTTACRQIRFQDTS